MSRTSNRRLSGREKKAGIVVLYSAYGLAAALWIGAGGLRPWPVAVAVVILMLAVFGSLGMLFQRTHYWKWGNSPDAELDEFEIASRNSAYKTAYVLVASLSLLAMLAARIGADLVAFTFSETARELLFWGWFLLVATLPAAILAWTEKPVDDEDEPVAAHR